MVFTSSAFMRKAEVIFIHENPRGNPNHFVGGA
jgi:hypothetical protein